MINNNKCCQYATLWMHRWSSFLTCYLENRVLRGEPFSHAPDSVAFFAFEFSLVVKKEVSRGLSVTSKNIQVRYKLPFQGRN